ncbi:hypothetical protein H0Z60_05700 [Ectothiorhodospiraceae bacterium WFHF3C12]|nr:hypothetical protein [Ectothiorhodospiraceae bacterium WFHF3C12]
MAIKSSDPRKIGESSLDTDRFGRIVADAWMSRHDEGSTTARATADESAGGPVTEPVVHAADATYQPFADLKELLHRGH